MKLRCGIGLRASVMVTQSVEACMEVSGANEVHRRRQHYTAAGHHLLLHNPTQTAEMLHSTLTAVRHQTKRCVRRGCCNAMTRTMTCGSRSNTKLDVVSDPDDSSVRGKVTRPRFAIQRELPSIPKHFCHWCQSPAMQRDGSAKQLHGRYCAGLFSGRGLGACSDRPSAKRVCSDRRMGEPATRVPGTSDLVPIGAGLWTPPTTKVLVNCARGGTVLGDTPETLLAGYGGARIARRPAALICWSFRCQQPRGRRAEHDRYRQVGHWTGAPARSKSKRHASRW
ncbi:hypothetical protein F5884DRAFT_37932 [Xylogone sp. PMI_703]|nr:hypothetical protein F5884DRAFT_37932 [Xylogone sp. PMI_703]